MQKKREKTRKKGLAVRKAGTRHEVVVRVEAAPAVPTVSELSEPMRDNKKMTIPRTWMSEKQLTFMLQRTPRNQVYRREGKGGKQFDYVTVSYMQRALNYAFGWNWDFEVVEHGKEGDHVWVLGKLTVRGEKPGQQIVKTQFGRSDVKKLKSGAGNVDYGNDLKSASSDALKKCCSLLGFASDVYAKGGYKEETGKEPMDVPTVNILPPPIILPKDLTQIPEIIKCNGDNGKGCGNEVKPNERVYSIKMYKKILCRSCQETKAAPWRKDKK